MSHIGIDIIEIARIEASITQGGDRFLHRVYTEPELKLCHKKSSSLAARFAGKEAVMKALGTKNSGISWRDIEILSDSNGKPLVHLHGKAQNQARDLGIYKMAISLSHSKGHAIAFVTGDTK